MTETETMDKLVLSIYQAGANPALLQVAAAKICAFIGADMFYAHVRRSGDEPTGSFIRHGISEQALDDYAAHYFWDSNPITPRMVNAPLDEVVDLFAVVRRAELERSAVYNDWVRPNRLHQARGWRGLAGPGRHLAATIGRSSRRAWSDRELERATRIVPYVSLAARLRYALSDAREEVSSLRALIDSVRCAAFLVDARRRVVAANAVGATVLRDARLLTYESGRLCSPDRFVDRQLQAALDGVLRGTSGRPVYLAEPAPTAPLAFVLPRAEIGQVRAPEAIVIVPPPDADAPGVASWLRATHGLSGAEAEVVVQIAAGHDPRAIAESRKVALGTVRNQIKRAMSKIGVRRRSQLVAVVTATAGPLGSLTGKSSCRSESLF